MEDIPGAFPLTIEVIFVSPEATWMAANNICVRFGLHGDVVLRKTTNNRTFVKNEHHFVRDAPFGRISDVYGSDKVLRAVTGVVETGLLSWAKAASQLWSRLTQKRNRRKYRLTPNSSGEMMGNCTIRGW
ncbi:ribose-5-phosphate isomerase A [Cohaesibacter gelatinilyticus]|uniref:ribose-5-phosphate isomerase A n=1 Tax=Cohaesibacter gelatinilyticus TaxID=372072 RepID=UPI000BE3F10A|nr:hypothetical protein [Hyphomicrobiales bacterium]